MINMVLDSSHASVIIEALYNYKNYLNAKKTEKATYELEFFRCDMLLAFLEKNREEIC